MCKVTLKLFAESRVAAWNLCDYNDFHAGKIDRNELDRRSIIDNMLPDGDHIIDCNSQPIRIHCRRGFPPYAKFIDIEIAPNDEDIVMIQEHDY